MFCNNGGGNLCILIYKNNEISKIKRDANYKYSQYVQQSRNKPEIFF